MIWCLSVVVVCQPFPKILSSETAWQIKAKFHVEPSWEGGAKICINGPGHMTNMAATPIYVKNLKTSSPEPEIQLGMQHRGLKLYKVYINDDPGLTLTYFTARSNLIAYAF